MHERRKAWNAAVVRARRNTGVATAGASVVATGLRLSTGGVAACSGCHGPAGAGNPAAHYPRIGGQNAAYTTLQLNAYKKGKAGERGAGKHALIMSAVATKLTDAEIAALSSYVAGLQ